MARRLNFRVAAEELGVTQAAGCPADTRVEASLICVCLNACPVAWR
ncbi:hypothetical protein [Pseudomonas sp. X4]